MPGASDDIFASDLSALYPYLVKERKAAPRATPDIDLLQACTHRPPRSLETLKILVVSTPKTGNTWVKHLLARMYHLPSQELPMADAGVAWGELGDRWVAHQHYMPSESLLRAVEAHNILLVTTIRHPADAFVSLFHHAQLLCVPSDRCDDPGFMLRDRGDYGEHSLTFLRSGFLAHLHLSLSWMDNRLSLVVRYEDLCQRPVETVRALCDAILPVTEGRIRFALAECELGEMRRTAAEHQEFFRKGGTGGWRAELPDEFQEVFRQHPPYPRQVALLGYSLDADSADDRAPIQPVRVRNPFRGHRDFENGVPIAPILKEIYFDQPEPTTRRWPENVSVGNGSYYEWLNQPYSPRNEGSGLVLTNLARQLCVRRPDVQQVVPDPLGRGERQYAHWLMKFGLRDHDLHPAFALALFGWSWPCGREANALFPLDAEGAFENGVPFSFVLLELFYSVPQTFAAQWLPVTSTARGSFYRWMLAPAVADPAPASIPLVSELAHFIYRRRPDVQAVYHDPFGEHRAAFLQWFRTHAALESEFDPRLATA